MRLVFDIETNGVDFRKGNFIKELTDCWCIVAYDLDRDVFIEYIGDDIRNHGIQLLQKADELIGHNIIQFDLPALERLFGFKSKAGQSVQDTLVLSRLLYPDRPGGHSLESWGERLGYQKGESPGFQEYSPELVEYCRRDVGVNAKLYERLQKDLSPDWDRAIELEHRIAEIIAEQERNGFWFYKQEAEELVNDWTTIIQRMDDSVLNGIGCSIRLDKVFDKPYKINGEPTKRVQESLAKCGLSPSVLGGPFCTIDYHSPDLNSKNEQKKLLLELGWEPQDTTPTGQPKLDESIKEIGPVGEAIHMRNTLSHRRSQVQGLIDLTDNEGRIHGGANPCGTNTTRMRHSRIVNIPRASSPYGHEIRSLFGVPDSKVLVGYDAASLELRILAHYIGNPDYNEKVTTKDKQNDAHVLAARAGGSDNRDLGKTINYALIYGAGDQKLGSIIGGTKADGAGLRRSLYDAIPGLDDLINRVQRAAQRGWIKGLDGRRLWIRSPHQALNTLVQGGGAVYMKTVTAYLDDLTRRHKDTCFKVCDMHDEAQWEVLEQATEIEALYSAIHEAFQKANIELELKCPQEAEIQIGKSWAETH